MPPVKPGGVGSWTPCPRLANIAPQVASLQDGDGPREQLVAVRRHVVHRPPRDGMQGLRRPPRDGAPESRTPWSGLDGLVVVLRFEAAPSGLGSGRPRPPPRRRPPRWPAVPGPEPSGSRLGPLSSSSWKNSTARGCFWPPSSPARSVGRLSRPAPSSPGGVRISEGTTSTSRAFSRPISRPESAGEDRRAGPVERVERPSGGAVKVVSREMAPVPTVATIRSVAVTQYLVPVPDDGWLAVITTTTGVRDLQAASRRWPTPWPPAWALSQRGGPGGTERRTSVRRDGPRVPALNISSSRIGVRESPASRAPLRGRAGSWRRARCARGVRPGKGQRAGCSECRRSRRGRAPRRCSP